MLKYEAIWLGKRIHEISNAEIGQVLDLGSSSQFLRKIRQPYINKYIFSPLGGRGIDVIHTDIELDVTSGDFQKKVKKMSGFKTIFVFNLLEHVSDYKKAAKNISSIIPKGGYLFVSCPKNFPHHPDPIDNGFRPALDELANLFQDMKIVKKEVIDQKMKVMFTRKGILFGKKYSASCLVMKR
jgi:hypothetical protein